MNMCGTKRDEYVGGCHSKGCAQAHKRHSTDLEPTAHVAVGALTWRDVDECHRKGLIHRHDADHGPGAHHSSQGSY
jgi:hypothetical protein